MAHEGSVFYSRLAERGVSRRDFLKFCGATAAMLGLSETMVPTIAAAFEEASLQPLAPALWVNGGACTGCTESAAQSTYPNIATIVLDLLSMNYIETVMMAQGDGAEEALQKTAEANEGKFIMIYEGSVMTGLEGNTLIIRGEPSLKVLDELGPKAAAVIAVGSCAVDGGWVRSVPSTGQPGIPSNPDDWCTGVSQYFAKKGIKTPVVNLPTCPVNPEWIVAMVVDVLLLGGLGEGAPILDKLDAYGRPKLIFGQTIHDNCPRRGHFENGEFVYQFGSVEEAKGYCLYPVGCKGPQTYTNCPIVRWNDRVSWCVESGSPCIGCGDFNWVDENAPFLGRMRQVGVGSGPNNAGFNPATAAAVAGGAVVVALGAHAAGMAATGRLGGSADKEKGGDK